MIDFLFEHFSSPNRNSVHTWKNQDSFDPRNFRIDKDSTKCIFVQIIKVINLIDIFHSSLENKRQKC